MFLILIGVGLIIYRCCSKKKVMRDANKVQQNIQLGEDSERGEDGRTIISMIVDDEKDKPNPEPQLSAKSNTSKLLGRAIEHSFNEGVPFAGESGTSFGRLMDLPQPSRRASVLEKI
jgi:hypothetical protein